MSTQPNGCGFHERRALSKRFKCAQKKGLSAQSSRAATLTKARVFATNLSLVTTPDKWC